MHIFILCVLYRIKYHCTDRQKLIFKIKKINPPPLVSPLMKLWIGNYNPSKKVFFKCYNYKFIKQYEESQVSSFVLMNI